MCWYVLFVRTNREQRVEKLLRQRLDPNVFEPFVPLHEMIFKISGSVKKELKPLFPGYVFIESEVSGPQFIKMINSLNSIDIVQILRYSKTEFAMRESERRMLLSLCNDEYCVKSSSGVIEGNKIYITDGPLKGRESFIKRVNRHKRQALIEIEFMGGIKLMSVALEIAEKIK